jgi:hypothetical protein
MKAQRINTCVEDVSTKISDIVNKIDFGSASTNPVIILNSPQVVNNIHVIPDYSNNDIIVSGQANDQSGAHISSVEINGEKVSNLDENGRFLLSIPNDTSLISIKATCENGNSTVQVLLVDKQDMEDDPSKGVILTTADNSAPEINDKPAFYAILIADSSYDGTNGFQELPSTIQDARKLENVLVSYYSFDTSHVLELFDKGYKDIIAGLNGEIDAIKDSENASLLIFYSGHGTFNEERNIGYWVPVGSTDPNIDYISNGKLDELIENIKIKHILILSDNCFSAAMAFKGSTAHTPPSKYSYEMPSRQILSAGGHDEVPSESEFLRMILEALKNNDDKYFSVDNLYSYIFTGVKSKTGIEPELVPTCKTGNEGGKFYFMKATGKSNF